MSNIFRIGLEMRAKIQEHKLLIALFSVKSSYFFSFTFVEYEHFLKAGFLKINVSQTFPPIFQILMITILTNYIQITTSP